MVVNIETLVHPKARLGTFGVVPDHKALGIQAANKIFELLDEDWEVDEAVWICRSRLKPCSRNERPNKSSASRTVS